MGGGADAFWGAGERSGVVVSWRACSGKRGCYGQEEKQTGLAVGGSTGCWQEMLTGARSAVLRGLDFVPVQ